MISKSSVRVSQTSYVIQQIKNYVCVHIEWVYHNHQIFSRKQGYFKHLLSSVISRRIVTVLFVLLSLRSTLTYLLTYFSWLIFWYLQRIEYVCNLRVDDLTSADWWNWWDDNNDDDAAAAAVLPDTPSTSSSLGCGSDGVPDSPLTLGPTNFHAAVNDVPWSTTDKVFFPAVEPTNRHSSYVPRDLLLCMTSRTSLDAENTSFVH